MCSLKRFRIFLTLFVCIFAQTAWAVDCKSHSNYGPDACSDRLHGVWAPSGSDWQTWTQHTNTTTGLAGFNTMFQDQKGRDAYRYFQDRTNAPASAKIVGITIYPGVTAPMKIIGGATVEGGSVVVDVVANTPEALDQQQEEASQLIFVHTGLGGSPDLQAGASMIRESRATARWGGSFTETTPDKKVGNPKSADSSFAVKNISAQAQKVLITISDSGTTKPTVAFEVGPLDPNEVAALVFAPLLGNTMFPAGFSGDFQANIEFKGLGGGKIAPLLIRKLGDSMTQLRVWTLK